MSRARIFSIVLTLAVVGIVFGAGCVEKQSPETDRKPTIQKDGFGKTKNGESVEIYTLTNSNGLEAKIMTYGGTVVSLKVPDKDGKLGDIVLGFDNLGDYEEKSPYFGCLVGRYGNRIGKGKFSLDGKEYTLAINNGENHLHGGDRGFDKVVWDAESVQTANSVGLKLHYLSKDMEEGYPGNLDVTVTYTLTDDDELRIDYSATTDKATVCNLTNHNYYNLAGQGIGNNYGNQLMINADHITPVDKGLITTGKLEAVKGTPFDFTELTEIGERIDQKNTQLEYGGGYDHNWVLNKKAGEMSLAAKVYEPKSGRIMEIYTTEPGLQFYSGNFLDGTLTGKEGKVYKHRYAYCLETQHYPDSPNKPQFPSTVLRPGQTYKTSTVHKFSVKQSPDSYNDIEHPMTIDAETVKKWSAPYRNWHYYPDHVIDPNPNIKGFEKVYKTDVPTVFQIPGDKKWYMTFIGFDGNGYQSFIAESDDLVNWTNMRLAMGYGPKDSFDYGGVVLGAFLYDSYDIKAPRTLKKKDEKYFSLYGAYPRQGGYELRPGSEGVAMSDDGITWKRAKDEPILSVHQTDCGKWEKSCIYQPWLVEHKGKYYNFYNAAEGHIEQMGMALSNDILDWKRYEHNPVIPVGPKGSYNDKFSSDIKIFQDGDHWVGFFFGVGPMGSKGGAHIMAAYSHDLYNWTVDPEPLYKASGNPSGLDKKYAHKISLIWNPENEIYYMFYNAVGNKGRGIGLITSKPLVNQ